MNQSAKVHSLDALVELRAALVKFREEAAQAMTAVEVEINRGQEWLSHDQLKFWKAEFRRCEDLVGEAKMALARCQLMKNAAGETPSCEDEKKQLAKAKARRDLAEEKIELVKKWTLIVEQEIIEYSGPAQQLNTLLDATLVQGIAELDGRMRSLEAYLQTISEGTDLGLSPVSSASDSTTSDAPAAKPAPAPPPLPNLNPPA